LLFHLFTPGKNRLHSRFAGWGQLRFVKRETIDDASVPRLHTFAELNLICYARPARRRLRQGSSPAQNGKNCKGRCSGHHKFLFSALQLAHCGAYQPKLALHSP